MKLIIDTDPGIDDLMAIFTAMALPEIELVGLTTIFGNVTVETATRNALRLVEMAGRDVPVAQGAAKPLAMPAITPSAHVHGAEGFGNIPAETPKGTADSRDAADFIIDMAKAHPGELVLCPIGPLTNIAEAVTRAPEIAGMIKQVVIMGGSVDEGGNITPHAEANIYHDPHAANTVFAADWEVVMIGLDVTHRTLCTAEDFAALKAAAPRIGGFIHEAAEFYLHFYTTVGKFDGASLHDPAALLACLYPEDFTLEEMRLRVVEEGEQIGATVRDPEGGLVQAAMKVDAARVQQRFMDAIKSWD
ncbi:nucleoside hydrolase [Paracoccaceae bacterium GXU_MW_L88]